MTDKNVEQIADRLHSAALHLMRWVRSQDEALGLSPARLSALSVIVFGGPLSLNKLAQIEQVKAPTMSKIVDALEMNGFVKRETFEKDKRGIVISATAKGTRLLHEGRRKRVSYLAKHLRPLSHRELDQIRMTTEIIRRLLEVGEH